MTDNARVLYRAAKDYIAAGQPVFPCHSIGDRAKKPMVPWKTRATLETEQAKRWWSVKRDAAIGLPTGILWDVLDVDVKRDQDGRQHLHRLKELGLLNGCQRVIKTPSGGFHLYFKAYPGLTNKAAGTTLGLDMRGTGGYVLAPPSLLDMSESDGGYAGSYEDLGPTTGGDDSPLLWELIKANITPMDVVTNQPINLLPSERRASVSALREWVSNLGQGERNNGLHWAVCRCIESGIDPFEMMEAAILIGLPEEEINLTIRSAMRRAGVSEDDLYTEAEAMFGTD